MRFRLLVTRPLLAVSVALLAACTTTEHTAETATPAAVPTEVQSDADRRAIYNSSGTSSKAGVPDATPNRVRLGEQASDINSQKRIENTNPNDPNNTTPETRMKRLNYLPPADTLRRP